MNYLQIFSESLATLQEVTKIQTLSLFNCLTIRCTPKNKDMTQKVMLAHMWKLYDEKKLNIEKFLECANYISNTYNNNALWENIEKIDELIN